MNLNEIIKLPEEQFLQLTDKQKESAERVLNHQGIENFKEAWLQSWDKFLSLEFKHIFIGIEIDGYAHS